jgi:hypothetical protein
MRMCDVARVGADARGLGAPPALRVAGHTASPVPAFLDRGDLFRGQADVKTPSGQRGLRDVDDLADLTVRPPETP